MALPAESARAQTVVTAAAETEPVRASGDSADDIAIWIHPSDPSLSTVIGTDNYGARLAVYNLGGDLLSYETGVRPNNVDVRYNFPLGDVRVPLVAFSDVLDGTVGVYTVDPQTRGVRNIGGAALPTSAQPVGGPAGFCL